MRAWPRSAAGSTSPTSPAASTRSCGAATRISSPAPRSRPEDLVRVWEEQKAAERAAAGGGEAVGTLAGVPKALPALTRAAKLGRRAARVGFDWPEAAEVRAKVIEELHEVDAALKEATAGRRSSPQVAEELGDLFFALANWGRHLEVDAEQALRAANAKFERRFARMEQLAAERELELKSLSLAEWEALWCEAKLNRT